MDKLTLLSSARSLKQQNNPPPNKNRNEYFDDLIYFKNSEPKLKVFHTSREMKPNLSNNNLNTPKTILKFSQETSKGKKSNQGDSYKLLPKYDIKKNDSSRCSSEKKETKKSSTYDNPMTEDEMINFKEKEEGLQTDRNHLNRTVTDGMLLKTNSVKNIKTTTITFPPATVSRFKRPKFTFNNLKEKEIKDNKAEHKESEKDNTKEKDNKENTTKDPKDKLKNIYNKISIKKLNKVEKMIYDNLIKSFERDTKLGECLQIHHEMKK